MLIYVPFSSFKLVEYVLFLFSSLLVCELYLLFFILLMVSLNITGFPSDKQEMQIRPLSQEDSHEEGNGNPLQYSCLGNLMDNGAWWTIVHGVVKELDTI